MSNQIEKIEKNIFKKRLLDKLPAIPDVVYEAWKLIEKGNVTPAILSEVIGKDITLSAKVLKLVNSPFYGFPNRIGSLKHAIVLLGIDTIKGLLISTVVFGDITPSIKELWNHACDCATTSRIIAKELNIKEIDELTVCGLLHDMGKVVIQNYFPEIGNQILKIKKQKQCSDLEAEIEVLGFSHDVINSWIAQKWNFPMNLTEGLVYHHQVKKASHYPEFAAVISLADFLTHVYRLNPNSVTLPDLEEITCEILSLTPDLLEQIIGEMDKSLYSLDWEAV